MKKFLLPLLAAVAISFGASAQPAPPQAGGRSPQEMAGRQAQRLSKELNLSADQSAKVQQILAARTQEMQAQRASSSARPTREQMQASRAKYDEQFKQVLTPEQFTQYTALAANRHHGPGRKDDKGKAKAETLKIKAKATDS